MKVEKKCIWHVARESNKKKKKKLDKEQWIFAEVAYDYLNQLITLLSTQVSQQE